MNKMNILNKKNICAKTFFSCILIIILILNIDYKCELMPFNTVFLLLYVLLILFTTIWLSFLSIQHVLNQNKPFLFQMEGDYYFAKIVKCIKDWINMDCETQQSTDLKILPIDVRIENFVRDIEQAFVRKWYAAYISKDETFLTETRVLLDIVVRRFLQISEQMNSDKIVHGTLVILLKHIKEYRRTVKKVRNVGGSIEEHYRYSHIEWKNLKALEHFTFQITSKLLRHFINWELYNSLACQCVTSVLSKKLVSYVLAYTSAPGYINHKIVWKCASEESKCQIGFNKFAFISISDVDHSEIKKGQEDNVHAIKEETVVGDICSTPKRGDEVDVVDAIIAEEMVGVDDAKSIDECDIKEVVEVTTPNSTEELLTQPVKIHESRSTNKTWRNSSDLDCISLGQDILYLSGMTENDVANLIEKRLWKSSSDFQEVEELKQMPLIKDTISEDVEICGTAVDYIKSQSNMSNFLRPATTGAATLITNTIKPIGNVTANTMKEFQQCTVINVVKPVSQATSNAMHKIGDFQDEAAGVVEGIFDFGMAGIRKGLRLTGLQDNVQHSAAIKVRMESGKKDIPKNEKQKLTKIGHVNSDEVKLEEGKKEHLVENVWVNPLSSNASPSFEGEILLERSPVTTDSRSFSSESTKNSDIPTMEIVHAESPDPEYEDTTDLATTTARLRALLAQKTTESTINTPTASPLSLVPTPLDPSGSSLEELSEVDGALPSMYKAWAKTATGVFQNTLNTLKTALPGNNDQEGHGQVISPRSNCMDISERQWIFVQSDPQPEDLSAHMEKFLNERRVFCTVDNAYEAIEAMELADQLDSPLLISQRQFDDELDDFDTTIPMTKALIDVICELIEDTYSPLVKENIVKATLLTTGSVLEEKLHTIGVKFIKSISVFIGDIPKFEPFPSALPMKIDEMVDLCMNSMPGFLMNILNDESVKSILKLLLESLQSPKINQDTNLQLLELLSSEIISAASQTSPTFSA